MTTGRPGGRGSTGAGRVAVVGSANLDVVVPVERHPTPGETVLGGDHFRAPGGKGGNQAVAAARLGAEVGLVAQVGDDEPGSELLAALSQAGVDVSHVARRSDAPSGLALIAVDPNGENTIVVSPGANARLGRDEVRAADELLSACDAVLLQLEIPLEAVLTAARRTRGLVILNPAPARDLPAELLDEVDVLVPNRSELAHLAGVPVPLTVAEVERAVRSLRRPARIVVTLGAEGVLVRDRDRFDHLPAHRVDPVDTTAAGDAFCGALAVALVSGAALVDAAAHANAAAALTVTRRGAQPSLPTRADLTAALAEQQLGSADEPRLS